MLIYEALVEFPNSKSRVFTIDRRPHEVFFILKKPIRSTKFDQPRLEIPRSTVKVIGLDLKNSKINQAILQIFDKDEIKSYTFTYFRMCIDKLLMENPNERAKAIKFGLIPPKG